MGEWENWGLGQWENGRMGEWARSLREQSSRAVVIPTKHSNNPRDLLGSCTRTATPPRRRRKKRGYAVTSIDESRWNRGIVALVDLLVRHNELRHRDVILHRGRFLSDDDEIQAIRHLACVD